MTLEFLKFETRSVHLEKFFLCFLAPNIASKMCYGLTDGTAWTFLEILSGSDKLISIAFFYGWELIPL